MMPLDTIDALDATARDAVVHLLYRLGDDDLVIGHRDSEWTGLAPILEADIAFSSMAQDEIGHAQVYYQLLHALGEPAPDALAFTRKARDYRCCSLVSLPKGDWAFSVLRQFLYDSAESVRLAALSESTFTPLAQIAGKLRGEEKYHLMHGRTWVLRLGQSTEESRSRMQTALDEAYPHALGIFEPTEVDEALASTGICPREMELQSQWASAVTPVLRDAGLTVPENAAPRYGGRVGRHPAALGELLDAMQVVHNIDPTATW